MLNTVVNEKICTFYCNVQHATCPIAILVSRVIEDLCTADWKKILSRLMTLIDEHGNPRIVIENWLVPSHVRETAIEIGIDCWWVDAIFDCRWFSICE